MGRRTLSSIAPETQNAQLALPAEVKETQDGVHVDGRTSDTHELLKTAKTIRIAVSGDVFVTALEIEVIDTKCFQRLRGIRQLGYVMHVYPTALHTRFDHALGTLAMADRMIQAIKNNRASEGTEKEISVSQEVVARLYALLHDITHIPFGHTIEDELGLLQRHDENPARILAFLGPESAIGRIIINHLGENGYARFMRVFLWEDKEERRLARADDPSWVPLKDYLGLVDGEDDLFIHDLVSNTVCADLLDYVARDSYFCNLGIGLEYRFLNFLYLARPSGETRRRVFVRLWKRRHEAPRRDTMTDLARLLEARYMIAERAYFHHTKIVSGAMLGRALQEHMAAERISREDEERFYAHSDDTLLHELQMSNSGVAAKLANSLAERNLHKTVCLPYGASAFAAIQVVDEENNPLNAALKLLGNSETRRQLENEYAERLGGEEGDVLIYAPPLGMNLKAAEMNVRWHGKDVKFLEIDDDVVRPRLNQIIAAHKMLWGIQILAHERIARNKELNRILRDAFEADFVCSESDKEDRQRKHREDLIHTALVRRRFKPEGITLGEIKALISRIGDEVTTISRDNRSLVQRIESAIANVIETRSD